MVLAEHRQDTNIASILSSQHGLLHLEHLLLEAYVMTHDPFYPSFSTRSTVTGNANVIAVRVLEKLPHEDT